MSTYVVGDIHGCLDELKQLLAMVEFDPAIDELWLTGDLAARGPKSLDTLRFIKSLGKSATTVLGNHDLHLLAVSQGFAKHKKRDGLESLFQADDCKDLLTWLASRNLLAVHPIHKFIMVHAGLSPQWSQKNAIKLANEVEKVLHSDKQGWLLQNMYSNVPAHWDKRFEGIDRYRFIINVFTRMRYCFKDGSLEFSYKKAPVNNTDPNLKPWFKLKGAHLSGAPIIFGHWAALLGVTETKNAIALDTGCVWGHSMTMLRWEDQAVFSCACPVYMS